MSCAICMVEIPPNFCTCLCKFILLTGFAKMLKDDNGIRIYSLHSRYIFLKDINTALIIVGSRGLSAGLAGEALRLVKSESIHLVFLEKIFQTLLHMVSDHFILMVQVVIYAIWVRSINIEPRVVGCSLVV